jgi:hypothetical protein
MAMRGTIRNVDRSRSLDCLLVAEGAAVFTDHAQFFSTEASVFDCHAEEHVFVFLVIGSECVLMEDHHRRVSGARFRKLGKLLFDSSDQIGLSPHPFVVGHGRVCCCEMLDPAGRMEGKACESVLVLDRLTSDATLAVDAFSTTVGVTQVIGIDRLRDRDMQLGPPNASTDTSCSNFRTL